MRVDRLTLTGFRSLRRPRRSTRGGRRSSSATTPPARPTCSRPSCCLARGARTADDRRRADPLGRADFARLEASVVHGSTRGRRRVEVVLDAAPRAARASASGSTACPPPGRAGGRAAGRPVRARGHAARRRLTQPAPALPSMPSPVPAHRPWPGHGDLRARAHPAQQPAAPDPRWRGRRRTSCATGARS